MPPKKQDSKKNQQAKASKVVEDKTFGLKNKNKSAKVARYVESVQQQVSSGMKQAAASRMTADERAAQELRKAKAEKEKLDKEMAQLFRSTIKQPKLEAGVDPKSVLCEFFKQGVCDKGVKCKFSHDLSVSRKAAKVNIYADRRDGEEGGEDGEASAKDKDTITEWDQQKLESVVSSKHGAEMKTEIVCKYFLDAIEKELYGWFWTCPGGGTSCKYRHALPPGYIFKTKRQREAEALAKLERDSEEVDIGELIEAERARLPAGGTKVTAETFKAWKEVRDKRKAEAAKAKQEEDVKKGAGMGKDFRVLSGRALFTYDPSLFVDDADAGETNYMRGEKEVDDVEEGDEEEEEEGEDGDEDEEEDDEDGDDEEDDEEEEQEEEDGGLSGPAAAGAGPRPSKSSAAAPSGDGPVDEGVYLEGADDLDDLEDEEEEAEEGTGPKGGGK